MEQALNILLHVCLQGKPGFVAWWDKNVNKKLIPLFISSWETQAYSDHSCSLGYLVECHCILHLSSLGSRMLDTPGGLFSVLLSPENRPRPCCVSESGQEAMLTQEGPE